LAPIYKESFCRAERAEAFYDKNKELNPAIRFNLLLFKEKSKRISTTIGARAEDSRRKNTPK